MNLPRHQTSMTVLMTPDTANFAGNVHGGTILKLLDQVVFREPIHVGELVTFLASINHTGRSSTEVGVTVLAEDVRSGAARHVNSCFFTMAAVNDQREAVAVRCWRPGNADDRRRHAAAAVRRELRLEQARRLAA